MKQNGRQQKNLGAENRAFYQAAGTMILSLLAVYGVIWAFTADTLFGSAVYNSYVLQAQRWLTGHLDLGQDYSYLEIAEFGGRYFISFPPIPSVILLPFTAVFGLETPDHLIAAAIGIAGALYALRLSLRMGLEPRAAVLWTLFLTIGSNFLHIGYRADVWYFAQVCAFAFSMMALYYAVCGGVRRAWIPLFCLALAVGCRPLNLVYLPLVVWLLWQTVRESGDWRACLCRGWWQLLPPLAVGVFLMVLNYARFGSVLEFGHNYLPEFAEESVHGQFWLGYIPQNLGRMFRLPAVENHRLVFPVFDGVALWLVSPIFLAWLYFGCKGVWQCRRDPASWLCLVLPALHILFLCAHKTLGGWQFGNRYTVDLLPCIFLGLLLWMKADGRRSFPWPCCALLFWGLGVNLVGTIAVMEHWITG